VITLPWGSATVSDPRYDWTGFSSGGFGANNDEIYIFTASAATDLTPTAFLYGVAIGSSTSARPQGLSDGVSFIKPTGNAARYKTTGATYASTADQIRTAIGNTASNWEAVAPVNTTDWSFSVLLPQTISFNSLSAVTYGVASFTLAGTSSSGLTVSYTSSNTGVATVSGGTVTIVGAGTTTITASQSGDSTYAAAGTVSRNLTVSKATPVLGSIPTASAITAGEALSNSTISGGTVTPSGGTWAWSDPGNTNMVEGTNSYAAVYTPALADQGNYLNLTNDLTVVVNAAAPSGSSFSGWLGSNSPSAALLLQYAYGASSAANAVNRSNLPSAALSNNSLVLTYFVRKEATNPNLVTPQVHTNLSDSNGWGALANSNITTVGTNTVNGVEVIQKQATVPTTDGSKKFLRLKVSE
jgi:hypothetical protein